MQALPFSLLIMEQNLLVHESFYQDLNVQFSFLIPRQGIAYEYICMEGELSQHEFRQARRSLQLLQ